MDNIQLGTASAVEFDQGGRSWAIVLPGAVYFEQAPLLWYARVAALGAGRNVLMITDRFDGTEPLAWVEERAAACLQHVREMDEHPLLIAKSISSLAALFAGRRNLPAVWITPLLRAHPAAEHVLRGLDASSERRLLIGGSADPTWDRDAAAHLAHAETLELPGADHALEAPGDWSASVANLRAVTAAIARFAA